LLGIPTVQDRMIQQAIVQGLNQIKMRGYLGLLEAMVLLRIMHGLLKKQIKVVMY